MLIGLLVDPVVDPFGDPADHLGIILHLPYTVTSHNNKVYVLIFYLGDVRVRGDHLLIWL